MVYTIKYNSLTRTK